MGSKPVLRHVINWKAFGHAWEGLVYAFTTQRNFRIHVSLGMAALLAGWGLGVSAMGMALLVFAVVLGLAVEMVNTAIESVTDLVTREWRQEAKLAKDVSAGMMLLTALGTGLVAGLVLGLPVWRWLWRYF